MCQLWSISFELSCMMKSPHSRLNRAFLILVVGKVLQVKERSGSGPRRRTREGEGGGKAEGRMEKEGYLTRM